MWVHNRKYIDYNSKNIYWQNMVAKSIEIGAFEKNMAWVFVSKK